MLWIVFAVIIAVLLLAAVWVDRSRKRRGILGPSSPVNPSGHELGHFGGGGGGDPGGGGGGS